MSERPERFRAFIAISLPGRVKQELKRLQDRLKAKGIKASWPRTEALHLTLKFLGEVPEDQVTAVQACMARAVAQVPCFQLNAGGIGVFPGIKKARVIWAGTGGRTDILEQVFRNLDRELALLGFQKEKRRFSPHFTLARIKKGISPKTLIQLIQECNDIRSGFFRVRTLDLFKSKLLPGGAVHSKLFEAELGRNVKSEKKSINDFLFGFENRSPDFSVPGFHRLKNFQGQPPVFFQKKFLLRWFPEKLFLRF
ncbi:RNA 2',3'-cyclic phosphodiesterase [Desulfospira joergensenii]|uniref:RNA 2',3'-cyclic phosphodiesterase n=1 Tax=Desulfospira joergensenii TaxID=53329 RepID=UPI00137693A0|nr:RNA 2',3'-cyclic phosphodiesterase [Desulfospira joergensenii]